jgi:hypothetical protein
MADERTNADSGDFPAIEWIANVALAGNEASNGLYGIAQRLRRATSDSERRDIVAESLGPIGRFADLLSDLHETLRVTSINPRRP